MNYSGAHIDRVYFLGIGGIGMSALARYFHREGALVSGYDRTASVVTKALEQEGIQIFHQEDEAHLHGQDLVVYTPAIPSDSTEFSYVRQQGVKFLKRAEVLGELSKTYQTLAVAGTHGKTTTSIMLAHFLKASGVDTTAFLGGISRNFDGNYVHGTTNWMVTEADEYDRSFLHLHPHTSVITSLDPDHLDIYGSASGMIASYQQFAEQSQHVLVHASVSSQAWAAKYPSYGILTGDIRAEKLRAEGLGVRFTYRSSGRLMEDLYLPMPGEHNVSNATAAITLALDCGADEEQLREAMASFSGIYRRFEVMLHTSGISYIDDYAHHPGEIEAAIRAARECLPGRQVVVVFQPHLYSRTRDFASGFGQALSQADQVLLMDIYPAREEPIPGVDASLIASGITDAGFQLVKRDNLLSTLKVVIQLPTVVLTLGAGNIDREVSGIRDALAAVSFTQPNDYNN